MLLSIVDVHAFHKPSNMESHITFLVHHPPEANLIELIGKHYDFSEMTIMSSAIMIQRDEVHVEVIRR